MKRTLGIFLLIFISLPAIAGSIFESKTKSSAIKICIVNTKTQADLCVYVAKSKMEAKDKDEIWYYVNYKYSADAVIYFVKNKYQADIKVYLVSSKSQAGWRTSNKFRGQLK